MARGFGVTTPFQDNAANNTTHPALAFVDNFANLNAWNTDAGAPSVGSNVLTLPANSQIRTGSTDLDDINSWLCRFLWNTNTNFWVMGHASTSGGIAGTSAVYAFADGVNVVIGKILAGAATSVTTTANALTNGTQYWLELKSTGTSYTANIYNDSAGALGTLRATATGTISDASIQVGQVALKNTGSASLSVGGNFSSVCRINGYAPIPWTGLGNDSADKGAVAWSAQQTFNGSRSLTIRNPTAAAQTFWAEDITNNGLVSGNGEGKSIPVLPSTTYSISGAIKTVGVTTGANLGAFFRLIEFDSSGSFTIDHSNLAPFVNGTSNGWTLVSGNFTTLAATAFICIRPQLHNAAGTAYFGGMEVRTLPALPIDDNVNSFMGEVYIPTVRDVQSASIVNRRRVAKIREDTLPLEFELRGIWGDSTAASLGASKYWRDYQAALLNQVQRALDLGDGTEFRMVDVEDIAHTRKGGVFAGQFGNSEIYVYTAKCLTYEPYARSKAPLLEAFKDFGAAGVGTNNFTGTYNYSGTAPGEPTWQWKLVLPSGCTVTSLSVQNSTTGETASSSGLSITNGTYYFLFDACGGGNLGNTPNNNSYGLLAATSNGYGATLTGTGDVDWTGNVPTLQPSATLPPGPNANSITATCVVSGAPATSIVLSLLAPARWIR